MSRSRIDRAGRRPGRRSAEDPTRPGIAKIPLKAAFLFLVAVRSVAGANGDKAVPAGVPSVEALLGHLAADGVAVILRDPKSGDVRRDPELGVPQFEVPDTGALARSVRSNRALMEDPASRKALIGCAKLASADAVPAWTDILRSVGREWDDAIVVEISYHIAAKHGPAPPKAKGIDALRSFVNRAIRDEVLEYREPGVGRRAVLAVLDPARLAELVDAHRRELVPDAIDAAIAMSRTRVDHVALLKVVGERLPDSSAAAFACERSGEDLDFDRKPEAAAVEFAAAIRHYDQLRDKPSRARVLLKLSRTNRELGKSDDALGNLREARSILELVHDGKHASIAVAHKREAEIHFDRGEVQRSLNAYVKAIPAFMALPADEMDPAEAADTLRLFAGINARMGHIPEARETFQQALSLIGQAETLPRPPETRPVKAKCLRDLGLLDLNQGRLPESRRSIDAALEIQVRLLGVVDPETIETLLALGRACAAADQPGEAGFALRQATILLRQQYGPHHPAVVRAHAEQVAFRLARSESNLARNEIERGLGSARIPDQAAKGDPSRPAFLPTRETVALLTWKGELALLAHDSEKDPDARRRQLDGAIEAFLDAERVFDSLRAVMPGDGDRILVGDQAPGFSAGLLAAYARKRDRTDDAALDELIFAAAERSTARSLVATLGEDVAARLRGVGEADLAEERRLFLAQHAALKRFIRLPYDPDSTELTAAQREAWDAHRTAIEALNAFNRRHKPDPKPDPQPAAACSPSQALALLGRGEAAVTFVLGAKESFAVVLARGEDRGARVSITRLPPASVLDEKIATLLGLVSLEAGAEKAAGEELYDLLLGLLAGQFGASDLLIVPTGALCRLPFELLREPGPGDRRYLGEARAVRYAPSLTTLRTLAERDRLDQSRPDRPFWAMANPRDPVGAPPSELESLPSLDGAIGEVKRIAAIVGGGEGARVLVEDGATRAAVLGASRDGSLRRYRYLHFATHGSMEDDAHPLPGLVLAPSPDEEGFLDAEDVGHLNLDADLVVLSACESGRGRIFNGEGVRGLSGAFLIAGARGVLCSLWKVDDEETARFMEAFYARLRAGATPAAALKDVRSEAARNHSSPQWSAFIFVGGVSP